MKKYDCIIVGGGIGGLMSAYGIMKRHPELKVALIEEGKKLKNRKCPILEGKTQRCINCKACAIMSGIAGAGAFSDGKFNMTTQYGGWLQDYIGDNRALKYQHELYDILKPFDDCHKVYKPNDTIKWECLKYDLHMLQGEVVHFGTDGNFRIMSGLFDQLKDSVDFYTETKVVDVDINKKIVVTSKEEFAYDKLILAVGRVGASWLSEVCIKNGIHLNNNQVDVGVRVELPRCVWEDISKEIYEPKILYRTKQHDDITRMFCFNSGGSVVMENSNGVLTVNGHANSSEELKTENSNFAILSTHRFTEPFNEPIEYAKSVARMANMISDGSVIVQRFGDLVKFRRTTVAKLKSSTVRPTFTNATPGDLSLCMPKRVLDNIIDMVYALDNIAPGTANADTLLYGAECKYYSARPDFLNNKFEISDSVYVCGDGAGISRSLSQAGASGLYLADVIY